MWLCLAGAAGAQVVLNEIVAANSDRLLRRPAPGYPRLGVTTPWHLPEFDDSAWATGNGPFGFGTFSGVTFGVNTSTAMQGKTPSLYARKAFTVTAEQAASAAVVELTILYNDGFIAFLNGVEVVRRNLGNAGMFAYHDQVAFNTLTNTAAQTLVLGPASLRLVAGTNLLCVQTHNAALSGTAAANFIFRADLRLAGSPGTVLVTNTGPWKYFPGLFEPSGGVLDHGLKGRLPDTVVWAGLGFNDSTWPVSAGPVGIEGANPPDYLLGTNLYARVYGITPSVYTRAIFTVTPEEASSPQPLQLLLDYDDGVIVLLNGREIARRNVGTPGTLTPHDTLATASHSANGDNRGATTGAEETHLLGPANTPLAPGPNVLAVQMHNSAVASADLIARVTLSTTGPDARALVTPAATVRFFIGTEEPSPADPDNEIADEPDPPDTEGDWIELQNLGPAAVSLNGWSLTDDPGDPRKWYFPAGTAIAPGGFLVVMATGFDVGPADGATYPHTNFKLASGGEYLGLVNADGAVVSQLAPAFPAQSVFHSWGRDASGQWVYYERATPGATNAGPSFTNRVAPPQFSPPGGFHATVTSVALSTPTPGAQIRYTRDGSEPTETHGFTYTTPLTLGANGVVRARAFAPGAVPSDTVTHTYLIAQSLARRMLPAVCLSGDAGLTFYGPNAGGGPALGEGVLAIRGGSFVSNLWTAGTDQFAFNVPMQRGRPYEKPAALEVLNTNGAALRRDIGLRSGGSPWSRPRYKLTDAVQSRFTPADPTMKPSFTLYFRGDLGERPEEFPLFPDSPVTRFYDVRLRAGKNDIANPFLKDELVRRMFLNLGHEGSRGVFVTLHLNGVFKGYFNLCEHLREGFMQEHHGGAAAWDVRQVNEISSGDTLHWNGLFAFLRTNNLADTTVYGRVRDWLDADNVIDYLLLNVFAAMWDWPNNNWVAARERSAAGRWRFYVWDAEGAFGTTGRNPATYNSFIGDANGDGVPDASESTAKLDIGSLAQTTTSQYLPALYTLLRTAPEFRLRWADRAQKHFFHGGALTREGIEPIYLKLRDQINPIMAETIGETVNATFYAAWILSPTRRNVVFNQMRTNGLWPATLAPEFGPHGGTLPPGGVVHITNVNASGAIYYTTNGADPRAPGGAIAGRVYTDPVPLTFSTVLKARARSNLGEWSPLQEAMYVLEQRPLLLLTEIMYHPANNNSDHEFLELKNAGPAAAALGGARFSEGINYTIAGGTVLAPGAFLLIPRNPAAFAARYPGVACAASGYAPSNLDNAGERVTLVDVASNVLFSVRYDDAPPWPTSPDGLGFSLVPRQPGANPNPDNPAHWRASAFPGGSPGADDPAPQLPPVVVNEVLSAPGPGEQDWIELHNPTAADADVSGWFLTDAKGTPRKFRIPDGTVLPPGGFARFTDADFNATPGAPESFGLSALGDEAYLYAADAAQNLLGYSHGFEFGAAAAGVTFGRHVTSAGAEKFPAQASPTPLEPNSGPRVGPVVITEIHYAPPPGAMEFVELRNTSAGPAPLFDPDAPEEAWRVEGFGFAFPPGLTLAPGQFAVVCGGDPAAFRAAHGLPPTVPVFGPAGGFLDNGGERLALQRPGAPTFDPLTGLPRVPLVDAEVVEYDDSAPWPAVTGGWSLQRVFEDGFGDDPAHWRAASASPGRPMSWSFAFWREQRFAPAQRINRGIAAAYADPDGDRVPNLLEYAFGTDPLASNAPPWTVGVLVTNGQSWLCVRYQRTLAAGEAGLRVQLSDDLQTWREGAGHTEDLLRQDNGDGTESVVVRDAQPLGAVARRFIRLQVALE